MGSKAFPVDAAGLRGTDSNTLLRMYDAVKEAAGTSGSQQERARANRALQRIAKELQKRHIAP
jgi:hypothetical protein